MNCPKCGGNCYDNRAENDGRLAKGEKMRPDFKCKDKGCDGVIWRPKEGWGAAAPTPAAPARAAAPAPATNARQPYSAGPPLPYEETAAGFTDGSSALPMEQLDAIFRVYDVCFAHAFSLAERTMKQDASHEGISAMAATCFIAARDKGIGG